MRLIVAVLLVSTFAFGQKEPDELPNGTPPVLTRRPAAARQEAVEPEPARDKAPWVIPAGTQIPVALKHAISTKSAKVGDAVYAQTTFPIVINEHVMIPAGTYVQGSISQIMRPGRVKGRGELLFHFTTLIYPNGYTVSLPGAVDQVPGQENSRMKDSEGTIQREGEKGKDAATIGKTAATGAAIGGATSGSLKGAAVGGLGGAAVGSLVTLLTRGSDLRIESGTAVNMILHRDVTLNPDRVRMAANTLTPYVANQ